MDLVRSLRQLVIDSLNNDARRVVKWSLQNGISINSSKSQSIVISRSQIDRSSLPNLVVDHNEIPYIKMLKIRELL